MEAGIVEGLIAIVLFLVSCLVYKLSPAKSRCMSCGKNLPLASYRYQAIINEDGEGVEKAVCLDCYNSGIYLSSPESGCCQRCSLTLKDIRPYLRPVVDLQYILCDYCFDRLPIKDVVPIYGLLTDSFLLQNTAFSSFDELVDIYPNNLDSEDDLNSYRFSRFVSENSKFDNYDHMIEVAKAQYLYNLYDDYVVS